MLKKAHNAVALCAVLCYTRAPARLLQFLPMCKLRSCLLLLRAALHCVTVLRCKYCATAACVCAHSCLRVKRCAVCILYYFAVSVAVYTYFIAFCAVHCKHFLRLQCSLFCVTQNSFRKALRIVRLYFAPHSPHLARSPLAYTKTARLCMFPL